MIGRSRRHARGGALHRWVEQSLVGNELHPSGTDRRNALALREPSAELVGRHGGSDGKALDAVGPKLPKTQDLLALLGPLGDDLEAQVVTEVDDRPHDHAVLRARDHAGDEGLVDLDLVDRELLELCK